LTSHASGFLRGLLNSSRLHLQQELQNKNKLELQNKINWR
jgi:hypothetical protein